MNINMNTPAMSLIATIASLQNGVEKNSDKACWYVWGVIKASFAKLAATVPGCATRFDTAQSAATPEKLAVITAKSPKVLYFTHADSKASVLNTSNRSVVCKVIAPEAERESFVTHAANVMRNEFGLTVEVAPDFGTLSVLTYYAPRDVAAALQSARQAETEAVQVADAFIPAQETTQVASEAPTPAKGKGKGKRHAGEVEAPNGALVIA